MSTPTTQPLQTDRDGRPVAQYWNPRTLTYEAAQGDVGAMQITSMQGKRREDFAGTSLNLAEWQTIQTGSEHTITVSASNLAIATGTTINSETIIRSLRAYTIPFRTMFIFMLSQRIANQEFFLEITNAVGNMIAQWRFDGVTATVGSHNTANEGSAGTALNVTIPTTAAMAIAEIELFPDEVYFHGRPVDSTAVRTLSAVRTRFIPDPNQSYFIQIRARNLGVAPASSTTLTIDAITVQDIAELTAEITGGRGQIIGSQAMAVQAVGGTIGVVSTVSTITSAQIVANGLWWQDTVTNLGIDATFTGTARDGASVTVNQYNRIRACISHLAGVTPGHLCIDQAFDAVPTWRETHRIPIPSDGLLRTFEFSFIGRQWRVRFINGATAQTGFFLGTNWVRMDGMIDCSKNMTFVHSVTALAASTTFTGVTLNLGGNHNFNIHRALVFADQTGTLFLEQQRPGGVWRITATQAVAANTPVILDDRIVGGQVRVRYVNGATLQGTFELQSSLITL